MAAGTAVRISRIQALVAVTISTVLSACGDSSLKMPAAIESTTITTDAPTTVPAPAGPLDDLTVTLSSRTTLGTYTYEVTLNGIHVGTDVESAPPGSQYVYWGSSGTVTNTDSSHEAPVVDVFIRAYVHCQAEGAPCDHAMTTYFHNTGSNYDGTDVIAPGSSMSFDTSVLHDNYTVADSADPPEPDLYVVAIKADSMNGEVGDAGYHCILADGTNGSEACARLGAQGF